MPLLERLRPSVNQALIVLTAVIWEDAIDSAATHAGVSRISAHVLNAVLVTIFTISIKAVMHRLAKTNLLEMMLGAAQMLAGWMWKAALSEVIDEAHAPVGSELIPSVNVTTKGDVDHNEGLQWGCQAVSLALALATTISGVALLRLLPVLAQPATTVTSCSKPVVAFHIVGTVAGSITLPMAFSWHYWLFNVVSCIVAPRISEPGSSLAALAPAARWAIFASLLLVVALATLAIVGVARMVCQPWLSGEQRAIPGGRAKRYETALVKTCDFLVAWCVFAVLQSAHQPIDASACYPEPTPHALETSSPPIIIVGTTVVLGIVAIAVVVRAHRGAAADPPKAALGKTAPCARRWRAHSWIVILGTLGIQLGWAVKDVYDAVLEAALEESHHKLGAHGGVLGALFLTTGAGVSYSCYCGAWSTTRPTMTSTISV